jgi:hypothetical protein
MQASCTDPTHFIIDTGIHGISVEMTLFESKDFVASRKAVIVKKISASVSKMKAVEDDLTHARELLSQLRELHISAVQI